MVYMDVSSIGLDTVFGLHGANVSRPPGDLDDTAKRLIEDKDKDGNGTLSGAVRSGPRAALGVPAGGSAWQCGKKGASRPRAAGRAWTTASRKRVASQYRVAAAGCPMPILLSSRGADFARPGSRCRKRNSA